MATSAYSYRSGNRSSESDSDGSDNERTDWKKASNRDKVERMEEVPVEPTPPPAPEGNARVVKRKRNNIWCNVLEDQIMSETLTFCGIKNKPKNFGSRGAESYDYTLGHKFKRKHESDDGMSDDTMSDISDVRSVSSDGAKPYQKSKHFVKLEKEELNNARMIVQKLGEKKYHLIYRVVKYVGMEKALDLLKKTEEIEENGGMMINNNQRRRTPGGVYIQLLKSDQDIKKEALDKVFEGELNSFEKKKHFELLKKQKKEAKRLKLEAEKQKLLDELGNSEEKQPEQEIEAAKCEGMDQEVELPAETIPELCNSTSLDLEDGEIENE